MAGPARDRTGGVGASCDRKFAVGASCDRKFAVGASCDRKFAVGVSRDSPDHPATVTMFSRALQQMREAFRIAGCREPTRDLDPSCRFECAAGGQVLLGGSLGWFMGALLAGPGRPRGSKYGPRLLRAARWSKSGPRPLQGPRTRTRPAHPNPTRAPEPDPRTRQADRGLHDGTRFLMPARWPKSGPRPLQRPRTRTRPAHPNPTQRIPDRHRCPSGDPPRGHPGGVNASICLAPGFVANVSSRAHGGGSTVPRSSIGRAFDC